jgi:hypothetical protein
MSNSPMGANVVKLHVNQDNARRLPTNQDDARRVQNKHNAMFLARNGIPVFPSNGKIPLVKLYNRRDTEISREDREAAIEQAREEGNKQLTVFVGATTDPDIVKRMWRHPNQDAVPSVACGPARLVVIDADTKFNGPELIGKLFDEHGGVPEGTPIITTQSGGKHYVFSDPDNAFTNSAGALKKQYGCDVRGRGGQFIAPGAWREDGKRYGDQAALKAFVDAYASNSIPPLPDYIVELIGTPSSESGEDIPVTKEREIIKQLDEADVPEWEELCSPLGDYDFDKLKADNSEFNSLYVEPGSDCSDNRFKAARHVMREWPEMPVEHLASFFSAWDGAGDFVDGKPRSGEYDNRQTAREWLKNQGLSKASTGEAFGAVVDEDEPSVKPGSPTRLAYLDDLLASGLPRLDWAVKHVVPLATTGFVVGGWGSGKTALLLDIALRIAHGISFAGRKVTKGAVIYCGLENSAEVERRIHAWRGEAGDSARDGAFALHRGPLSLYQADGKPTKDERELVKHAAAVERRFGMPVSLIVIDTLAQAIMPGDDNSAQDAGVYTAAAQRICNATGACVVTLAHPPKNGASVRGSGAFEANTDFVFLVSKDERGSGRMKAGSKFRVGDPRKIDFTFRLRGVTVGTDEDGDPIETVVASVGVDLAVTDPEEDDDAPAIKPSDRLDDRMQRVLNVFEAEATRQKADDEPVTAVRKLIELQSGEIENAVNASRRADGLEPLGRSTVRDHIRSAVEAGSLEVVGTKARPLYRLR